MRNRHLNKGRNRFALYCLSIPLLLIVVVHTCKSNYENIALSTDIELMLVLYLARKFGSERKEQHNLQREEISINNIHWFRRGLFFYFFTILMMKTVMITLEILFFKWSLERIWIKLQIQNFLKWKLYPECSMSSFLLLLYY